MIRSSCVVDAFRIGDENGEPSSFNRDLLEREMNLLEPQLVITVGEKARGILGLDKARKQPTRFFYMNFLMNYHKGKAVETYKSQVTEVRKTFQKI